MKIIEKKDWTTSWALQFTCKQCESKLEATATDLKYAAGYGDQRDYTPESYYVTCPVCSQNHTVQGVPAYLQKLAKERTASSYHDRFNPKD